MLINRLLSGNTLNSPPAVCWAASRLISHFGAFPAGLRNADRPVCRAPRLPWDPGPGRAPLPSDHDRRQQPALGRAPALALPLHRALRQRLPDDGPVPLSQNPALALPQTPGVPRPAGQGPGWTEPPAGQEEEEGTDKKVICYFSVTFTFMSHIDTTRIISKRKKKKQE